MVRRQGFGLAEIMVAVALFAMLGLALFSVLSSGATAAARGSEMELAATMGARVVDRLLADGYRALAPYAGREGDIDLTDLGPAPDGLTCSARYRLDQVEPGLLKLVVTLSWNKASMTLIRFIADPQAADQAREAFPS